MNALVTDLSKTTKRVEKTLVTFVKALASIVTFSPFRDYEIPMPENLVGADTTQLPTPPFGSESPDTTALEFLRKSLTHLLRKVSLL